MPKAEEIKKIYRSTTDKVLTGVCGGFAEYFAVDPIFMRFAWIAGTIITGIVPGVLVYILAIFMIPKAPAEKK